MNNPSWAKIPGRCKITDNAVADGGVSYVSYYTTGGFYTVASAAAHCNAYQSMTSYSSEWVDD